MAFPVLAITAVGAMAWVKRALVTYGALELWNEYGDRVTAYVRDTALGKQWLTDAANNQLQQAGINIQLTDLFNKEQVKTDFKRFIGSEINRRAEIAGMTGFYVSDIFDKDALKSDVDRYAASVINAKIGTTLTGVQKLTKDQIMQELGGVMAQRINAEAGTTITNIFPVARLRSELGAAVIDQLDTATVNAGAIITRDKVKQLKDKVAAGLSPYVPPNAPLGSISDARRAANRAAQKKYRRRFKAVYVPR